jgi:hypothetical protein
MFGPTANQAKMAKGRVAMLKDDRPRDVIEIKRVNDELPKCRKIDVVELKKVSVDLSHSVNGTKRMSKMKD